MGEVCKASTGMDRPTADRIVRYLLDKYEDHLADAPEGETYERLYDLKADTPLPRYQKLYDGVRSELKNQGLPLG
jgi:hypothetical protein